MLAWLAARLAHLLPPRPPGTGGTPPLSLQVRLDAVAAVLLDGLSYRRAGRMVGISKTEVGDSLDLLLGPLGDLGFCQPDGSFITSLDDLRQWLGEMAAVGEAVCLDGLATRVQRPRGWANQKVLYDAKRHTHTAQGLAVSTIHGDLLWVDGGWPGSCHEHELIELAGLQAALDDVEVASLLDRGFRGLAKTRQHWHAPVGDRRTIDRLTGAQRAYNRLQAGLRALVEQSIAHVANAWALRRRRGLLYRVRDVFRAAGVLICLGRWSHRVPHDKSITDTLSDLLERQGVRSRRSPDALRESAPGDVGFLGCRRPQLPGREGRGGRSQQITAPASMTWRTPWWATTWPPTRASCARGVARQPAPTWPSTLASWSSARSLVT